MNSIMIIALLTATMASLAPAAQADVASALPRVASINLCADQLLIDLAEPAQISSLSHLASEPQASRYHALAGNWPANDNSAESVLLERPELVIAGEYGSNYTQRLLERAGVRVERLPLATSLEEVFANIELVGAWIGQEVQATARVTQLRQQLAQVTHEVSTTAPLAAIYDPNGYTVGRDTLRGEQLALAGFRNAATLAGIESYGLLSLESMVVLHPDVLIDSPYSPGTFSRGQQRALHPALRSARLAPMIVPVPSRDTICGGPWSVQVVARLADARAALEGRSVSGLLE